MSPRSRAELTLEVVSAFGAASPEARLVEVAEPGWSYTPSMIATQLKLDIHLALSTLIHVSTHRFPVLELRVAALDSEGVDIVFPLEAVRDYLDGSGPLIDPRTGEAFQRVDDVRIAFVAAGIAP